MPRTSSYWRWAGAVCRRCRLLSTPRLFLCLVRPPRNPFDPHTIPLSNHWSHLINFYPRVILKFSPTHYREDVVNLEILWLADSVSDRRTRECEIALAPLIVISKTESYPPIRRHIWTSKNQDVPPIHIVNPVELQLSEFWASIARTYLRYVLFWASKFKMYSSIFWDLEHQDVHRVRPDRRCLNVENWKSGSGTRTYRKYVLMIEAEMHLSCQDVHNVRLNALRLKFISVARKYIRYTLMIEAQIFKVHLSR
jgi:hypothetical protein